MNDFTFAMEGTKDGWSLYVFARCVQEQYERAIGDFTAALEMKPGTFAVLYERGLAFKENGEKAKAIVDLKEALAAEASDAQHENTRLTLRQWGVRAR